MKIYEASIAYRLVREGNTPVLNTAEKVTAYIADAYEKTPYQESFWVICLNRKNRPINRIMITLGSLTQTSVHPREIFKPAIMASAAAIIVSHNHPSGDPTPSAADIQITRQLLEAAKIIGIELLDHVIVGNPIDDPTGKGWYSLRDAGVL